jgi:hypothetical protein
VPPERDDGEPPDPAGLDATEIIVAPTSNSEAVATGISVTAPQASEPVERAYLPPAPELQPSPPPPQPPYGQLAPPNAYPPPAPEQVQSTQPIYYGMGAAFVPSAQPTPRARVPRRTVAAVAVIALATIAAVSYAVAFGSPSPKAGGGAAQSSASSSPEDIAVRAVWRTAPVEQLLPASIKGNGTETYIRLAVSPDLSCGSLPAAFAKTLAPTRCVHLLEATYTDRTQTVTSTVGIVVLAGSSADRLNFSGQWDAQASSRVDELMPHVYTVPGTVAAGFTDAKRVAWNSKISGDGTYLVYAVSGFADGRTGTSADERATDSGSALSDSSPPVQAASDLPDSIQEMLSERIDAIEAGKA